MVVEDGAAAATATAAAGGGQTGERTRWGLTFLFCTEDGDGVDNCAWPLAVSPGLLDQSPTR